jgi:UDP-N-acetylglucosamine 2-epimerase (non-hydrolysing)
MTPTSQKSARRILLIAGTRPELIKLAPLMVAARNEEFVGADIRLILTGQHRELVSEILPLFGLSSEVNLQAIEAGGSLSHQTAHLLARLPQVLETYAPDVVAVQGDTSSAVAGALAAFHARVPVAHVEAGLRTHDLSAPFPEEANRRMLGILSTFHFCPTERAAANLRSEQVLPERLVVTGNTVVDALRLIRSEHQLNDLGSVHHQIRPPFVLMTAHRRESFGEGLRAVCEAVKACAQKHPETQFVYPVHLNPHVWKPVHQALGGVPNVLLIPPVSYVQLLTLLQGAACVMTDSGGIQEEAPSFGQHCLVLREKTERLESVEAGLSELVGLDPDRIVAAVSRVLRDGVRHDNVANPYGDGHAAERILRVLMREGALNE